MSENKKETKNQDMIEKEMKEKMKQTVEDEKKSMLKKTAGATYAIAITTKKKRSPVRLSRKRLKRCWRRERRKSRIIAVGNMPQWQQRLAFVL